MMESIKVSERPLWPAVQAKFSLIAIVTAPGILIGCSTDPDFSMATPAEGWRILDAAPPAEVQSWSQFPSPMVTPGSNWVWVQHNDGRYGQCARQPGDDYCSGPFEILSPNADEVVLIVGTGECH